MFSWFLKIRFNKMFVHMPFYPLQMHFVNNLFTVISTVLIYRLIFSYLVNTNRVPKSCLQSPSMECLSSECCQTIVFKILCFSRAHQEMYLLSLMGWKTITLINAPNGKLPPIKLMQLSNLIARTHSRPLCPLASVPVLWAKYFSDLHLCFSFFFLKVSLWLLYFNFFTSEIKIHLHYFLLSFPSIQLPLCTFLLALSFFDTKPLENNMQDRKLKTFQELLNIWC